MKRHLLWACLALAGCIEDQGASHDGCAADQDCPPDRPFCAVGGVCRSVERLDAGPRDDAATPPDAAIADAAPPDAAPPPDAAIADAAPPPDAAEPVPDAACAAGLVAPAFDDCNGVDDDCDGLVDEGDGQGPPVRGCYDGPPGTAGTGLCRPGTQTCVNGTWGACQGQVLPDLELCNGQDDDCDGRVDDGGGVDVESCYDGPPGTEGIGICHAGHSLCANGAPGPCQDEQLPGREICNGVDDDCDGLVDDVPGGCTCDPGTMRPCYSGPPATEGIGPCHAGTQACFDDGAGYGACEGQLVPQPEACNGVDDDCDGLVDDAPNGCP